jgi:hypothetical protein
LEFGFVSDFGFRHSDFDMEWLTDLLGVEAPPGTRFSSGELDFRPLFHWGWAIPLVVALGAGVFFLYWRERGRINPVVRGLMATLRTALIVLLVLMLFRPILLAEFEGERAQPVVLLLDNSQSMKIQDRRLSHADQLRVAIARGMLPARTPVKGRDAPADLPAKLPKDPPRADLVKAVLANPQLDLLAGFRKHGPLRPYLFGQDLHGAVKESLDKAPNAKLAGLVLADFDAHEPRTGLADAVNQLLQRKDGELPAAIVVMTDGRDNASKLTLEEVASECARLGVPLHIYGVGSAEGGSLQLKDVVVADTLFFDDVVAVPLRWRAQGFKGGTVEMKLTLGGKVVAQRDVPVRSGEELRDVLTFTPPKGKEREEKLDLVASIRLKDKDGYADSMTRPVRLLDSKVKVLYVENTPRWEFKFLQPALLRDRRVEAKFILVGADPETLRPPGSLTREQRAHWPYLQAFPTREKLLEYDLVILGDVPTGPKGFLTGPQMEWLREYVEDFRGGLVVIAGRQHMPAAYHDTPLGKLLPVEFLARKFQAEAEKSTKPYHPVLTEAGRRAEMLALADAPEENLRLWRELPGFFWHYPVTKLRPGATSLLSHPRAKMGEEPMTVLALHTIGKGQVLFAATDETWRWRYNAQDKYFGRFWGQLIYQMGLPHLLGNNSSRVHMELERSEALLGRPGLLYVRLLDRDFRGLKVKNVTAELRRLDAKAGQPRGRTLQLERDETGDGQYRVLLPHDTPGRFEVHLTTPEPATFQYRVNTPPQHELEEAPMADEALREAARVSGGRFYQEEDLHSLADSLRPRREPFTMRQEVLLWNWLTFALFVLLITVEWVLRKFSNLS